MSGLTQAEMRDHPIMAFVAIAVVAAVYVAFQFAIDGQANVIEAGAFTLVLSLFPVGLSILRHRLD